MAKIFPSRPPESIMSDPLRSGELKVFMTLKSLPDPFLVFYNTNWQDKLEIGGVYEGEADFIIAHPEMGVIVLEVKGGGIRYDGGSDLWYSRDRAGVEHDILDPVNQARKSHYQVRDRLQCLPDWQKNWANFWHAVCFPDVVIPQGQYFKPDLPRDQIIDKNDLDDITTAVKKMFAYSFGPSMKMYAPGEAGMRLVEKLLANSFEFRTPLGVELEKEDEKLVQLTEQQFRALSILGKQKRAAITGCAGSGKTMLAVKKAQQFSDLGLNVLFVCFNNALADYLKTRLIDATVTTFHSLCQEAANQARITIRRDPNQEKLFTEIYPQVLMDAAEQIGRVYDAIIIDEAQDFHENYWIALEALLKQDGALYIFFDDNQNIFHGSTDFGGLISGEPFTLTENCRNTKLIHETVKKYHANPEALFSFAPDGRKPEQISYQDETDMQGLLKKILHRLVNEEAIETKDIVILTPKGQDRTSLQHGMKLGNFTLTTQQVLRQTDVMLTSIQKFKGLERRVVIMTEIDELVRHDLDKLLYIGFSRARTHLITLHKNSLSIEPKQEAT